MEIAFVLLNCDLGFENEVVEKIKDLESVKEVYGTFGAFDIIVKVGNIEQKKIREVILWKIRKIHHVRSTLTLMGTEENN